MLKHARSETLLSQRSFAHSETLLSATLAASTLAAKLRVRSQQSLESTRSFDRTRSFAATIVEASTHSSGSKLRYTRSFSYFRRNRSTVLASLTACRRVGDEPRGRSVSNHIQTVLKLPHQAKVRAPFEMEDSTTSYLRHIDSVIARLTSHMTS